MSARQDPQEMIEEDMEKFRRLQESGGFDNSLPAWLELIGATLTAILVGLWMLSLLWVPDPIGGRAWMGVGMIGLVLFGGPTALIYWLRRGGAQLLIDLARSVGK